MHEHVHTLFCFVLLFFSSFVPVYALSTAIDAVFIINLILYSIRWARCKFSGVSNCLLIDFLRIDEMTRIFGEERKENEEKR